MKHTRLTHWTAALAVMAGAHFHTARAASVVYSQSFLSTDFASAGYGGMRGGDGTGTIELKNVSGTVTQALLYWHGPQFAADTNASVLFDGTAVRGVSLGLAGDNCWGFAHSQAYRADVTALVTGTGSYSLASFIKNDMAEINGVSLLVAFDDGDDSNNRDIMLFEGNDSNLSAGSDPDGWQVALGSFQYASGDVLLELGVSDGQYMDDAALELNGLPFVASGPVFEGTSVPHGPTSTETEGGLWDIRKFEIDSLLSPGLNTLEFDSGVELDCLSLVHVVLNLPAGTSPTPPPDRVPDQGTTLALFALSLALIRGLARRPPSA